MLIFVLQITPMNITLITTYTDRIYEAVLKLLPQLDPDISLPSKDLFQNMLSSEGISFFIAENEAGEIGGMLTLVSYLNVTGKKYWIEDVVVDNVFRGQGIGGKLIKATLEYAETIGAKEVKLTSRPFREAANRLYLKMGFVRYETNVYKYKF
jgi:ribosomal protein S18 acetylase RimI-like enzyme